MPSATTTNKNIPRRTHSGSGPKRLVLMEIIPLLAKGGNALRPLKPPGNTPPGEKLAEHRNSKSDEVDQKTWEERFNLTKSQRNAKYSNHGTILWIKLGKGFFGGEKKLLLA